VSFPQLEFELAGAATTNWCQAGYSSHSSPPGNCLRSSCQVITCIDFQNWLVPNSYSRVGHHAHMAGCRRGLLNRDADLATKYSLILNISRAPRERNESRIVCLKPVIDRQIEISAGNF